MNLIANDQSDNSFLCCSKFTPLELSGPASHEKFFLISEFKVVFFKLTANDQTSKCLICCLKFIPMDYLPLPMRLCNE